MLLRNSSTLRESSEEPDAHETPGSLKRALRRVRMANMLSGAAAGGNAAGLAAAAGAGDGPLIEGGGGGLVAAGLVAEHTPVVPIRSEDTGATSLGSD